MSKSSSHPLHEMKGLGAVILAGGRSVRMGRDKALLPYHGKPAVEWIAEVVRAAGAERVIVAGDDYGLPFVADPVAYGGPVGGLLAGAAALAECERLLVVAVDAPALRPADLAPLLAAPFPGAVYAGQPLPMAVDRSAIPQDLAAATPLRRFVEAAELKALDCPPAISARLRGANTPMEWQALQAARS